MKSLVGKMVKFVGADDISKYHEDYKPYHGLIGIVVQDDSNAFGKYENIVFPIEVKFADGVTLPFNKNEIELI